MGWLIGAVVYLVIGAIWTRVQYLREIDRLVNDSPWAKANIMVHKNTLLKEDWFWLGVFTPLLWPLARLAAYIAWLPARNEIVPRPPKVKKEPTPLYLLHKRKREQQGFEVVACEGGEW